MWKHFIQMDEENAGEMSAADGLFDMLYEETRDYGKILPETARKRSVLGRIAFSL